MISEERQIIKHKGGRPRKAVNRTVTSLRLTKMELYVIKSKAAKAGLRVTAYIRQMAINGKLTARLKEEERHFVRELVGMANNLNQLTKKGHQEGLLTSVLMFEKYRNMIDELLEKLK
ncbi:MAG: plasmid mobilization relaxosome protein MobC [Bacteroidota bacterium]|nr:plasmid mobilization relaxosome protein MobC [Bacteroidota bacterium]